MVIANEQASEVVMLLCGSRLIRYVQMMRGGRLRGTLMLKWKSMKSKCKRKRAMLILLCVP
jgi:hypothetical protein